MTNLYCCMTNFCTVFDGQRKKGVAKNMHISWMTPTFGLASGITLFGKTQINLVIRLLIRTFASKFTNA